MKYGNGPRARHKLYGRADLVVPRSDLGAAVCDATRSSRRAEFAESERSNSFVKQTFTREEESLRAKVLERRPFGQPKGLPHHTANSIHAKFGGTEPSPRLTHLLSSRFHLKNPTKIKTAGADSATPEQPQRSLHCAAARIRPPPPRPDSGFDFALFARGP